MSTPATLEPPLREARPARRASLAVGLAPTLVLLALIAVVAGLIEPATGLRCFVSGVAWTVYEMYRYLQLVDEGSEAADTAAAAPAGVAGSAGPAGGL